MTSSSFLICSKVEAATNEMLIDPDWAANMEICDMFNRDPHLGQALIRTLTSRMKHKDPKTGVLAVQLLEALIKNCPHFHAYVATEDFMHTLVKVAKGKYANSKGLFSRQSSSTYEENNRIEKTLLLLQSLGKSFANSQSYPIFRKTYSQLKREGIRFPAPLKDEGAPIFSPPAKKPEAAERKDLTTSDNLIAPDMRLAQENAVLLYTMLDSSPESADLRKDELTTQLVNTCRGKHNEVLKILHGGASLAPEKMSDALAVNDVLIQVIAYYDGLMTGTLGRKKPESKKKKKDKDKGKDSKGKKGKPKPTPKKKPQSDSESGSEYSESQSEEEDMLGFGPSPVKSKRSPKPKSKQRKGVSDKKDKHKEAPPRLAPPSSSGKRSSRRKGSNGSSPNMSPKHTPSDDADDLLDFADLNLSNGNKANGDDFFSFDDSPSKTNGKKKQAPAPASGGDTDFDDDEFFAIANRHAPAAKPVQRAPPQATASQNPFDDDAFFAGIDVIHTGGGGAGASSNNGSRSTNQTSASSSGGNFLDEFDPLS